MLYKTNKLATVWSYLDPAFAHFWSSVQCRRLASGSATYIDIVQTCNTQSCVLVSPQEEKVGGGGCVF